MTNLTVETSRQFYAKLAGFTFLFYIAAGVTVMFLMNRATDAEGTHAILLRIAGHNSDVRIAIILELFESFSALVLAVMLYGITRDESQELAMLAMVCRVCEGLLGTLGLRNTLGLLWLSKSAASAGQPAAANALGDFLLMPTQSVLIGGIFFAVGSMIFSYLLLRGRIIPTLLAWLGLFASVLLVLSLPLQLVGILKGPITWYIWLPMVAFEIPVGLWLLIKGVPGLTRRHTV
jgi:hypothetical protein